jgi:hypothetical protein
LRARLEGEHARRHGTLPEINAIGIDADSG